MNILMLFGALQGLILVVILFVKKQENKKARFYLALILFGLSFNLLYYFSIVSGLSDIYPEIKLSYLPWSMLSAISFYLYICYINPLKKGLSTLNKLGFLPFILFMITLSTVKFTNYFSIGQQFFSPSFTSYLFLFEEFFAILFTLLLGFLSFKKLGEIEIEIQQQFSNYNKFKLQFHKRLILVLFIFCSIWAISITYTQLNNIPSLSIYFSIWLFIAFVIQWITWIGFIKDDALLPTFFKKENITFPVAEVENKPQIEFKEDNIENKKVLKFDKDNEHYKTLIHLFEKEQIFLQSELSLDILSNKLKISKSYLSALINQTTDKNFYHFINSYRADYLIALFKDNKTENFTILSLAYEAGFNSKSTFQSFFKKYTGKTPSQYIKALQLSNVSI